jgi:hypothetical protein
MMIYKKIAIFLLAFVVASSAQKARKDKAQNPVSKNSAAVAGEDISGMYSFLREGEFVQINLEQNGVSGYISREGSLESDRGEFLDQFFTKASLHGHDLSFTTRPVHGIWFEFKGRFERGPAKSKTEDGYYVLRGTLTEFSRDADNKSTSHSREVEFKWMAQPDDQASQAMNRLQAKRRLKPQRRI